MICVADYGMGNLRSVEKALERLGCEVNVTGSRSHILAADKLIVPGVGAFGDAMRGLLERDLVAPIQDYAHSGRPLLGICLGMQILFGSSEEDPGVEGLCLLPGSVARFRSSELKIPHMGWNTLAVRNDSRLLAGADCRHVYFVHSYHVVPEDSDVIAATTEYGMRFVSAVESGNIMGTQFHPEKSQEVGLGILSNFARL